MNEQTEAERREAQQKKLNETLEGILGPMPASDGQSSEVSPAENKSTGPRLGPNAYHGTRDWPDLLKPTSSEE